MRIPGADEALEHLARWAARGRWKEECMRAIADHFEPVCAKAGITEDELAEDLGKFHYEMVEACAFEDFCSRRAASMRDNVIDEYLDQRGWKESLQARDYLRALRSFGDEPLRGGRGEAGARPGAARSGARRRAG
ncbi:MAG: hypothetical protein ABSF85_10825 [Terriglobales bacterium]